LKGGSFLPALRPVKNLFSRLSIQSSLSPWTLCASALLCLFSFIASLA
jgi:hypothetical protein